MIQIVKLVGVLLCMMFIVGSKVTEIPVPDFVGMTVSEAETMLDNLGFAWVVEEIIN